MKKVAFSKIAPCLFAIIIDNLGFGLVYPVLSALFTSQTEQLIPYASLDLRHFYLALAYMLYPLFMFFGAAFLGDLSDIYGRKRVISICMFGLFFAFFLMGFGVTIHSIALLLVGRALSGLLAGSQPIVQAAIVDLSTKETKAFNMSLIGITLSFGLIAGPVIGGFFSDKTISSAFGFSIPFYLAALLALICVVWIALKFEETFQKRSEKQFSLSHSSHIFLDAFLNTRVRFLSLIFLLMQVGFSLFFTLVLIYLRKHFHYLDYQLGLFNGWIGVSFAFAMIFATKKLVLKFTPEKLATIMMFITAVFQLLFFFWLDEVFVWALVIPIAGSNMIAYIMMVTSFSNTAGVLNQGWVMGISIAMLSLAWVISALMVNFLDIISSNSLIGIGGILLALAAVMMFFYTKRYTKTV